MKRTVCIALSVAAAIAVICICFAILSSAEEELALEDVVLKDCALASDGTFTFRVKCDVARKYISSCGFTFKNDVLCITVKSTVYANKALQTDEEGFAEITLKTGRSDIYGVNYCKNESSTELDYKIVN